MLYAVELTNAYTGAGIPLDGVDLARVDAIIDNSGLNIIGRRSWCSAADPAAVVVAGNAAAIQNIADAWAAAVAASGYGTRSWAFLKSSTTIHGGASLISGTQVLGQPVNRKNLVQTAQEMGQAVEACGAYAANAVDFPRPTPGNFLLAFNAALSLVIFP